MKEKSEVYVIFTSTGLDHRGAWEGPEMKKKVMSNEEILGELEERCNGIEFVGRVNLVDEERKDLISRSHYGTTEEERRLQSETYVLAKERMRLAIEEIQKLRDELAGVVIFGPPSEELISTGLPIVTVFPMWSTWMAGFKFKSYRSDRVLTAFLPVVRDASPSVFESRLADLTGKITLMAAISNMKNLKALVITDEPSLGSYEYSKPGLTRKEYEELYLTGLREVFGSELLNIPQEELLRQIEEVSDEEAKKIAKMWIDQALGMRGTNQTEVVKSAKVYLAMKALMEKNGCTAVTAEGYGVFAANEKGPIPSQGLASSQLLTDGVTATSECLINSLLLQDLGFKAWGRPSFNGDYVVDPFNGIAIVGHCECPLNPYGDERRSPFVIRNLPRWRKNEGGACVQVNLPTDETVTVVQISVYDRKISVFTGRTVSGEKFFTEWDNLGCRTKLAIETDTDALLRNVDWDVFGSHRVVFYGDLRSQVKDLARLIGFDLIEEDK